MLSDIEIAQRATLRPIKDVAAELGLEEDDLEFYGKYKAKVNADAIQTRSTSQGRLVLVTGINPNPAGEGKSTVAVGLADCLRLRKQRALLCLRQPSLGPVFVHAGPFGHVAHGCNSVIATRTALAMSDIVVTEAGFGADLGAEKCFDIKCRFAGLQPEAAVIVATIRALKLHGGVAKADLTTANVNALKRGFWNLARHVANIRKYRVPPIVAINQFATDTPAEIEALQRLCGELGAEVALADVHGHGGEGALQLTDLLLATLARGGSNFRPLYPVELPLKQKIEIVAREIYGAKDVAYGGTADKDISRREEIGLREVPVCMAKTQYSFSDDPKKLRRPEGFTVTVREVTPSAGAGFVGAHTGDIMTMPGLPKRPAAEGMTVAVDGTITGLF